MVKKLNDAMVQAMKTPGGQGRNWKASAPCMVSDDRTTPDYLGKFVRERDRQMGRADQGQRRERGLACFQYDDDT